MIRRANCMQEFAFFFTASIYCTWFLSAKMSLQPTSGRAASSHDGEIQLHPHMLCGGDETSCRELMIFHNGQKVPNVQALGPACSIDRQPPSTALESPPVPNLQLWRPTWRNMKPFFIVIMPNPLLWSRDAEKEHLMRSCRNLALIIGSGVKVGAVKRAAAVGFASCGLVRSSTIALFQIIKAMHRRL